MHLKELNTINKLNKILMGPQLFFYNSLFNDNATEYYNYDCQTHIYNHSLTQEIEMEINTLTTQPPNLS